MPQKAKFTKEQITEAAFAVVREEGEQSLTARMLAKKLGSSACPIFTVFENMEEVRQSIMEMARLCYKGYVERGLAESIAFKGVGMQYILFATEEPKLFQLLFMKAETSVPDLGGILPMIDENYDRILQSITDGYGVGRNTAEQLYRHLWIYTHGIATLCATKMCHFAGEEISKMMTEVFIGLLKETKRGESQ